jgi:serine/threonine-protein kinase
MDLAPGLQVTPNLVLCELIGQGGMGEVWLAESTTLQRRVIIKFITGSAGEDPTLARARFTREAALAAKVSSPNVVTIFDHGHYGDNPYIVMEFLEGEDLSRRLRRDGRLPIALVSSIIQQLGQALTAVHAAGIVHRDIKPANIFLCPGAPELVKLLDFGIAKSDLYSLGDASTTTGTLIGTPFYMSPEHLAGKRGLDAQTDLWAVGVLAFEALTGERPFVADTLGELVLQLHSMTAHPPLAARVPGLSPALDAWFARACAVAPQQRFGSAMELAHAFTAAMHGVAPAAMRDQGATTGLVTVTSVASAAPPLPAPKRSLLWFGGGALVAASLAGAYLLRPHAPKPIPAAAASTTTATEPPPSDTPIVAATPLPLPSSSASARKPTRPPKKARPASTYEDIE